MLKCWLAGLILVLSVPAKAGSADTAGVPGGPRQGTIVLYGNPAVEQRPQDNNSGGSRRDPSEVEKNAGLESKKTVKGRVYVKPGGKNKIDAEVKKKLEPVHFKEMTQHKSPYTCRWALGKVFEIILGSGTIRKPLPQRTLIIQNSASPKN